MTHEEAHLLHESTLTILEQIGVRLEHDEVYSRVLQAGARPGPGPHEARFPREMVAEYLRMAPAKVTLDARDSAHSRHLSCGSPSRFWTNPGLNIREQGRTRPVTSKDLAGIARLCEELPNVDGVMGMAMEDVEPRHRDFTGVRVIAENCSKHVRALCFTPQGMRALLEMKQVFPGNWLSIGFTAHGPLRWTHLALGIFLESAGAGIPSTINGEPMAGVTGPVTIAGSAAVGNAEILSGIVVNQILEPGRPVIYNLGLAHTFDMRHATAVTGGPENALFARISAHMGRFYRLPSSSWVSTESLFDDGQAALEKAIGFQTHISDGVSLIWGLGQLESEKTLSLAQLVIDNEIIDYVGRYLQGFEISPETVNLDLIREVGIGGSFLETDHTLMHFREHLWNPGLLNRKAFDLASRPLETVAEERARTWVEKSDRVLVDETAAAELRRIERRFAQLV